MCDGGGMTRPPDPDQIVKLATVRLLLRSGDARAIRERAAVSREEFARAIGVGTDAIFRWETGLRRPRREFALRLAEAYGSLDRLVGAAR